MGQTVARPYAEMKLVLRARVSAWRRHRATPTLWPKGVASDARGARRADCFLPAMSSRVTGLLRRLSGQPRDPIRLRTFLGRPRMTPRQAEPWSVTSDDRDAKVPRCVCRHGSFESFSTAVGKEGSEPVHQLDGWSGPGQGRSDRGQPAIVAEATGFVVRTHET